MKRFQSKRMLLPAILSIILIAAIIAGLLFLIPGQNKPKGPVELLQNPGFEAGTIEGYERYGHTSSMKISPDYARSGDNGLLLYNRTYYQATYAQKIEPVLTQNGPGTYKASVWVKLNDGVKSNAKCQLVIEFQQKGAKEAQYYSSEQKVLTDSWQEFVFEGDMDFDPNAGFIYAYIYQRSYDNGFTAPDVCMDDFSLMKLTEVNGTAYSNQQTVDENRASDSTVGAIRWDAWYAHDGVLNSTISQVERSLSPAQFHFRAPFYAKVTEDDKITIPEYNQEIFDQEILYAKDAGLDYFVYVWANDSKAQSRKFHAASQYRNDVKMCACFHELTIGDENTHQEIAKLMQEDYYMKVLNGRPLMYYFVTNANILNVKQDIAYYRQLAKEQNTPDPYVVAMNVTTTPLETIKIGADAISNYSVAGGGLMPFRELSDKAFNFWETYRRLGADYVPIVSAGWQTEPRFINPVTWQNIAENSWAQYPTATEIRDHLKVALAYLNHPDTKAQTDANTCIIYAWNEFDEGGWLCPTIAVDDAGKQLFNPDGTPKVNTQRLEAVKEAIADYKANKLPELILKQFGAESGSVDDNITS